MWYKRPLCWARTVLWTAESMAWARGIVFSGHVFMNKEPDEFGKQYAECETCGLEKVVVWR